MGGFAAGLLSSLGGAAQKKADEKHAAISAQKKSQADIYWGVIKNPDSSPDQIQHAQEQLGKLYPKDPEIKQLFQKLGGIIGQVHPGAQQPQGGGGGGGGSSVPVPPAAPTAQSPLEGGAVPQRSSVAPPPKPSAATAGPMAQDVTSSLEGAGAGTESALSSIALPPAAPTAAGAMPTPKGQDPRFAEMAHRAAGPTTAEQDQRKFDMWQKQQGVLEQAKIAEAQAKAEADAKTKGVKQPTPKPINYAGPDGQPLFGSEIISPDGKSTLYDQEGHELPPGTHKFSAWMAPKITVNKTYRSEPQPRTTACPASKSPASAAPKAPKANATPTSKSDALQLVPGARVVGGKVPPGVAKAYETYNGAQERYAVMQDAYDRAMKDPGDQQAMLNLLANHIGMTMGLQKGSRITQAIYEEALTSAPLTGRVDAHFDKDGYLTGVVLTPDQMKQMMPLAKVRLEQDKAAWDREVSAAKGGYGMGKSSTPPPPQASAGHLSDAAKAYLKSQNIPVP